MRCMPSSFVTYIDESGCDGFQFEKGSSEWLVLAGCVFRKNREPEDVKIVDGVREKLKKDPKKDLHFAHLNHVQRAVYAQELSRCVMRSIVVAIHKPSLTEVGTWSVKNRLYHYATRLLLERISWLCVEYKHPKTSDGFTDLVFSHRRNLSYEDVKLYIDKLKTQGTEIDWSAIDSARVKPLPHRLRKGLWISDAVASSFYQGLESHALGVTESRYALSLKRTVWSSKGNYAGNGLKIFPNEALRTMDLDGQHDWVRTFGLRA
jgi:hypothetical protein